MAKRKYGNYWLVVFLSLMVIMPIVAYAQQVEIYDVADANSVAMAVSGHSNDSIMAGEVLNTNSVLINSTINKVIIKLDRHSTVVTNELVYVGVWDGSIAPAPANRKHEIATFPVSQLSTTPTLYTFSFQPYTFDEGDVIGVMWTPVPAGSLTDISIYYNNAESFDGTNTQIRNYGNGGTSGTGWTTLDATADIIGTMYIPSSGSGIDCTGANQNLLICRLEAGATTPLAGASELVGDSIVNIAVQTGIISGGDLNPQTNGVGYLMTASALAIFIGLAWVASRGDLTNIPTFVWFIGTISIVGAMTAFEYIDATFLVISVVVIVAFAVAKAKGVFTGQGLFAGETR